MNEILCKWNKKYAVANVFPSGPMLKENAMKIKKLSVTSEDGNNEFSEFSASDGWLQKWKHSFGVKERMLVNEADIIPEFTISPWIERLPELIKEYEMKNILNVDELGLFLKALPDEPLVEKSRKCKGGQKAKQRLNATFYAAADASKVGEPVIIWKSQSPRCFKNLQNIMRPNRVHNFA